jgi:predicted nucleotidyltransferase component of viral defense system
VGGGAVNLTPVELARAAAEGGYPLESFEKVLRLLELLDTLRQHPFLAPRVALKGGTALNLFVHDVPRLSVDLDFNYLGPADREGMLAERSQIERAFDQVCGRAGVAVRRIPDDHAGGKRRLAYTAASGRSGALELDVNYMLRTPLWPPVLQRSRPVGGFRAERVPVLDPHELAAGKLAALVTRSASRDVFDARELLRAGGLDSAKLRLAFVVYGGVNRADWRHLTLDKIAATPREVEAQLVPMLRADIRPSRKEVATWTAELVRETRALMAAVLPLAPNEREFIERLNQMGEIAPEVLTGEPAMVAIIREHPGLRWKVVNVRKHRGLGEPSSDEQ